MTVAVIMVEEMIEEVDMGTVIVVAIKIEEALVEMTIGNGRGIAIIIEEEEIGEMIKDMEGGIMMIDEMIIAAGEETSQMLIEIHLNVVSDQIFYQMFTVILVLRFI